ncbi:hypothetical protein [Anabaena sp. CA = ATCC 33047]|uniref:hypothetical protein n=1 Tax=Anabaena sp. (strain CA / ATCC 33047) TaxID=52271 RepID=UPI000834D143|nr:hypothetical protein [Anabaena sp. CA = ATCC 33047]
MLCSLLFWVIFGWLADYSFPFAQALELLLACFKGTVAAQINSLQLQLQRTDIVSQLENHQQLKKLNNLESQAWLYQGVLERLVENSSANHEKIARTLEALEYKRSEILQELEPRKPQRYRILEKIQDSARYLLASQAEKDYERLEMIVTNLVLFTRSRPPSQFILSEVTGRLALEIAQYANQISPYRLRLAYKIDDLIKILSTKIILTSDTDRTDSSYQKLVNELRTQINLLSEQFNSLLRSKQKDSNELNKRIHEIYNLTNNISDLQNTLSDKDAHIVAIKKNNLELVELVQRNQAQIYELQNLISRLQSDIDNSAAINQKDKYQINYLQNQLYQLNKQKEELSKIIQDISTKLKTKESEIETLQQEKNSLNYQAARLQKQYQVLSQDYQQQKNEISKLKEQIKKSTKIKVLRPDVSIDKTAQQPIRETRKRISPEEYHRIINKSDYEYVRPYQRKDGTPVSGYYRRRKNR